MAIVLLARHGETEWNATHRWQGFTGPPLNEVGLRQAHELCQKLAATQIDAIYSSDSTRAVETAEIAARPYGLVVRQDNRLREMNFGEWEGLTRHEIDERYAGALSAWAACTLAAPPGGETDQQMADRVIESLCEIAAGHPDGRVLVVTSSGPMRAVDAHAEGVDQAFARLHFKRPANCAVYEVVVEGSRFTISGKY